MDLDTVALLSFATLIVANRAVLIGEHWYRRKGLFWLVQLSNLAGATWFAGWGIEEFAEKGMNIVNWMLSGLLVMHILQNNNRFTKAWRANPRGEVSFERRQEVLDKLTED